MKVVFTHGYFISEDLKEQKIMRPYPPLGILYLSAWLDLHKINNEVFDSTFSNMDKCNEYLLEFLPDVVAIYTNLMTKLNVIQMIQFIKSQKQLIDCKVILGGPDVRHNIDDYLATGADIAVVGEGEQTMLEIVKTIQKGVTDEFGHIDGLAYRTKNGNIITTRERTRIKDVNDLPFPNRHKINIAQYLKVWKNYHGKSAMTVSTQRGCPYTCKWCSTAVYGQSYRRRSPKLVTAELKELKEKYNPDSVWFVDDVFTVSHKWLEEFKNEVIAQDAMIPFECITRADRMNEDVVRWLKEAGAFRIWIGAESGSQKVIDLMDRRVEVSQVREMIHLTKDSGMQAGTFIMLGYPGETEKDIKTTVQHLKDCDPDQFTITIAYPIKGTSLYHEVEAIQTKELNWNETTDRDRDFKRAYSRRYYNNAVRWVENEVRAYQKWPSRLLGSISYWKHRLKAIYFYILMCKNK